MTTYASAMMLSKRERTELTYLLNHPLSWGGHLQRGQRLNDPMMIRWLDAGLIEAVDKKGYCVTAACRKILDSVPDSS